MASCRIAPWKPPAPRAACAPSASVARMRESAARASSMPVRSASVVPPVHADSALEIAEETRLSASLHLREATGIERRRRVASASEPFALSAAIRQPGPGDVAAPADTVGVASFGSLRRYQTARAIAAATIRSLRMRPPCAFTAYHATRDDPAVE